MLKKNIWLRERIYEQKKWMDRCGSNLEGYIANYGDPGIPPLKNGQPHSLTIPENKQHFIENTHKRVIGTTDQFYANCYGDGGTKIYHADYNRLLQCELELRTNHALRCRKRNSN